MSTVTIKIKVINQLTGVVEIDNGDGITIQGYNADVMVANAEAMADMMPDCQVNMVASNGDVVCIPSRNLMKDADTMPWDEYMAKWYPDTNKVASTDQSNVKQYSVEVLRTAYRTVTISVTAKDAEEAMQIALDKASTVEFSDEFDADYEIGNLYINSVEEEGK